jgi:hypothetical protein
MSSADRQPGAGPPHQRGEDRPLSALPSRQARGLAFAAIVVAGICGALIGYSFVSLQCHGACTAPEGGGAIVGGTIAATGVAVIAVLVLRAMGEWRTITQQRALEAAAGGPGEGPIPEPRPEQEPPRPGLPGAPSGGGDGTHDPPGPAGV